MRKPKMIAVACGALMTMGVALAQIEATSVSTYFLDVDPARYTGPAGKRITMHLDDEPRRLELGPQDEVCLQLQRAEDGKVISARVRVLRPEPHDLVVVRVAGPGISPGTYRSTPWGMLLRVTPAAASDNNQMSAVSSVGAPVCDL
jgi:hypothetical protein